MTAVIVCPPPSVPALHPDWPVPHPGFGMTWLYRNGREVWSDVHGDWYEEGVEPWTIADLTKWCPVRRGVGWSLVIDGPMRRELYRLRRGYWILTETADGFA